MGKTYVLWFAFLAILLGSCTREELYTKPNENYSGQKFKIRSVERITFDEMLQKLPAGTLPASIRLSAANGRSVEEFDIDSTLVKQILFDESGVSYTMRIIPKDSADTENELYNFTISQNNGATEEKIIRYTLEDGEVIADEEHTEVVYSKSSQGNCIMIFVPCEYGNYHHDGSTCEGHGSSIIIMCPGGGTTGGGGEPGEPGGDGPTTPTGPGGFNPSEGGNGGNTSSTAGTPCEKTKAMIKKSDVKAKLNNLYEKSKSTEGGERAFMMKNDGTPSDIIPGGEHNVDLTNMQNHKGVYHNHTNKTGNEGIKMVSPRDIYALFSFIVKQPTGALVTDAFVGMVGAQPCAVAGTCPPDGYEMFNYVVRFSGTYQDAEGIFLKNYDFDKDLSDKYKRFENETRNKSGNSSQYGNYISNKGLEELFFYIIGKMEIPKNKMILQRIDKNGNVTNVTLGTDGKPKDAPCS